MAHARPTAATLLIAGLTSGCAGASPSASTTPTVVTIVESNATVVAIVDGDTIDVAVGGREERVRLTGIDTPEIAHRPDDVDECFGPDATAFTAAMLPLETPVRLERDVVARDDYGRVLAYVYRATDGAFVNLELVRSGHAQPLSIGPNTVHSQAMVAAARSAEREGLGLWGACGA
jgi:micrococcal nuclease